ncbi:MAG: hypothetical protein M3220_12200 [Chloroflexota bacterium]|nr:hypothetical protein [Chloroflexota bacterium]
MARRKIRHVRITCPHCGKDVTVQPPRGFQRAIPCPNCRIPIAVEYITPPEEEASTQMNEDVITPETPEAQQSESATTPEVQQSEERESS